MMFMLGAKDRRVPLQDGLQYIAALRSVQERRRLSAAPPGTVGGVLPPAAASTEEAAGDGASLEKRPTAVEPQQLRVLTFSEDSHALDKPQTEFEQWLNVAWWLKLHGLMTSRTP